MTFNFSDTEKESLYDNIELKSISDIIKEINLEDSKVALAVNAAHKEIEAVIEKTIAQFSLGGRLFYIGAGTSGRLGILDASECPPTFGVSANMVIGIIAGGDTAIRKAVEFAEDDLNQGFKDLQKFGINTNDMVVGIAASGRTPYVIGAVKQCKIHKIPTACIVCSGKSELAELVDFPIEILVGPEYITGSTRMKSGTAQKMVLNMITTATMIKLGKVSGNKMVDMQLSNEKLVDRGAKIIVEITKVSYGIAQKMLLQEGSVRKAINKINES